MRLLVHHGKQRVIRRNECLDAATKYQYGALREYCAYHYSIRCHDIGDHRATRALLRPANRSAEACDMQIVCLAQSRSNGRHRRARYADFSVSWMKIEKGAEKRRSASCYVDRNGQRINSYAHSLSSYGIQHWINFNIFLRIKNRTTLKCVTTSRTSDHPTDRAPATKEKLSVCGRRPGRQFVIHVHDAHMAHIAMYYLFFFFFCKFILILIYSLMYSNVVCAHSEQRMNGTNVQRDERKKRAILPRRSYHRG